MRPALFPQKVPGLPTLLRHWMAGWLLLVLLAWSHSGWADAHRIELRDDMPLHHAWPVASILNDPSRVLSIQDVIARTPEFAAHPAAAGR